MTPEREFPGHLTHMAPQLLLRSTQGAPLPHQNTRLWPAPRWGRRTHSCIHHVFQAQRRILLSGWDLRL